MQNLLADIEQKQLPDARASPPCGRARVATNDAPGLVNPQATDGD
jgi:hypothetical protein